MTQEKTGLSRAQVLDWIWNTDTDQEHRVRRGLGSIERNFKRAGLQKTMLSKMLSAGRLLDVGCGYGYLITDCRRIGVEAVGFDLALNDKPLRERVQNHWRKKKRAIPRLVGGYAAYLPFIDNSFAMVTNIAGALSYAMSSDEAKAMLAEQLRVIRKGGRIYISPVVVDGGKTMGYLLNYVDQTFALRFDTQQSHFSYGPFSFRIRTKIYIIGQSWNNETQNHEIDGFVIITKL